jgi:hypothetical protein
MSGAVPLQFAVVVTEDLGLSLQIGFRSGDSLGQGIKLGGALMILNMPVDVRPLCNRWNDVDALPRLFHRHLHGQDAHIRERPVESSCALTLVIVAVTVEPAPFGVAFDQVIVELEDLYLCPDVGGLPGDGAGQGMKFDGGLRVTNFLESVRDVDHADVSALVRDFVFLGRDDERVAFDFCALVEVA